MTNNNLLLYRLGDLMLEKQQHILALDDLFEDEQIGAFVRSIQIDSPYQQLIFEGVLTETIKEERIMVTFTVEGYFHYVLGEVIEKQTLDKGPVALKELLENNKLRGIVEGVEQCLVRDVEKNDLSRLMWLIDEGGKALEITSYPLAQAFLMIDHKIVLSYLLENPTENDLVVILKAIYNLEIAQKNKCLLSIYTTICKQENYDNVHYLTVVVKAIPFISKNLKLELINRVEIEVQQYNNLDIYPEIIFELGTQYLIISNFEKAISLFDKSIKIFKSKKGNFEDKLEKIYSNLGSVYWYKQNIEKAEYYFKLSHKKCLQIYGLNHPSTADAIHNLALIKVLEENYDESIAIFEKALDIILKNHGNIHPLTARNYSNIGSAYLRKREYRTAHNFFNKALSIDKQIFHKYHHNLGLNFDDIGDVYFEEGSKVKAREYYEKSKFIFEYNYGADFPHVKLLQDKILTTNDQ